MLAREGILALLETLGIPYRLYEHEAIMTMAEAENVRRILDGTLCKCLLLKDLGGSLRLLVTHGDCRVDMRKLADQLDGGRLSFAPPEELEANLGCKPGSATVLGLANDTGRRVTAVVQDTLLAGDRCLHFHPMENTASVGISAESLVRFLEHVGHAPVIVKDIAKRPA